MRPSFVVMAMASNRKPPEPSPQLLETVLGRIAVKKRRRARRRFVFFAAAFAASAIGSVPAYQFFRAEFYSSGFAQFLWLVFSDPGMAIAYWQDFGLSLLELLPIAGFTTILASVFIFLGSLRLAMAEMKHAFAIAQAA